jgi:DNA-binding CsgD family transcriptional regulator
MASVRPMRSASTRISDIRPNGRTLRVAPGAQLKSTAAAPPITAGQPGPFEPTTDAVESERRRIRLGELSPRERQIVRLVAEGHVNKAIGAVLDISPWTVATHLRRIFAKLGVASRGLDDRSALSKQVKCETSPVPHLRSAAHHCSSWLLKA